MIKKLFIIVMWLILSLISGIMLAALGTGSLTFTWIMISTGFMALLFSPILIALIEE